MASKIFQILLQHTQQKVVFLLGSNLGNRERILRNTEVMIEKKIGIITCISAYYESEAWGFKHKNKFLNIALIVETNLLAEEILVIILDIEKALGRKRSSSKYEARTIDIDILFYGNEVIEKHGLIIPHKLLHKRKFALKPLKEIMPDFIHPRLNKRVSQLYDTCDDMSLVKLLKMTKNKRTR